LELSTSARSVTIAGEREIVPNTLTAVVRQVGASTTEGTVRSHTYLIDRPTEKGGANLGAMGGEVLLVALGGCFSSHLLAAGRAREANLQDLAVAVSGTMDGSPERFVEFRMMISASCASADLLTKLVTIAERSCQVVNTLRQATPVVVSISTTDCATAD
jgi:putative redox protein